MKLPKSSREYIRGVMAFVKFAREHSNRKWVIALQKKKEKEILNDFKPSRNAEKPYKINSRWFFLNGLKPSNI